MVKEISLVERTKNLLFRRGALAVKTHGSSLSQGESDLLVSYPMGSFGIFVAIEMKVPGEKPRPLQFARLRKWAATGAIAFWSDNPDEVIDLIEDEIKFRKATGKSGIVDGRPASDSMGQVLG